MKYLTIFDLGLTLSSCDFKSAQDYFDEATKLEDQEKYSDAILVIRQSHRKKPKINNI